MLRQFQKTNVVYRRDLFPVVSKFDDALDLEKMDLKKYLDTRLIEDAVFCSDKKTVFYLRLLPENIFGMLLSLCQTINGGVSMGAVYRQFFKHCVVRVENLAYEKDGISNECQYEAKYKTDALRFPIMSEDDIQQYFGYCPAIIEEIGQVAYQRHFLAEGTWQVFKHILS